MSSYNLKKSFKVACAINDIEQQELAASLGYSKQYVSNVISGSSTISVTSLDKVAAKLGYKLYEFLELGEK